MIVTLSPAKLMNFEPQAHIVKNSQPQFVDKAIELINILQSIDINELANLLSINQKMAFTAYQQIHSFMFDRMPIKQAALTYNGIAYLGLDFASFSQQEMDYAQKHLIIFSGLYGALHPLDQIKPYRLEMQAKLDNNKGCDLYTYWREILTQYMIECLRADDNIWVNLMSSEYTKVINQKILPKDIQIITPSFKEQTSTGYRQVVVHTKKARGMIARFILKNKLTDIEHIKAFDDEGYSFSEQLSKGKDWVFTR